MVRLALAASLIIEGVSLLFYADIIWGKVETDRKKVYLGYLIGYLLIFVLHSFHAVWSIAINVSTYTLVNVILLKKMHHTTTSSAICHACAISFYSSLSEIITGTILNCFMQYWGSWKTDKNLTLMALSNILFFFLMISVALLQKKRKNIRLENLVVAITIVIIFAMSTMVFLSMLEFGKLSGAEITICIILLAIVVGLTLFLYGYMEKIRKESERIKQQLQLNKDNARYVDDMMRRDEEQRILIHDIKNHLQTIAGLCEESQGAVAEYINNLLQSPALRGGINYSNNKALNAIIYRYSRETEALGISFAFNCDRVNLSFLSDYDISTIFCNILDNAVEAARKTEEAYIDVCISHISDKGLLVFKEINSCQDIVKCDSGRWITTKKGQKYHGYGLLSVDEVLKKHGATMELYQDRKDNSVHTVIVFSGVNDENHSV